MKKFVYKIFIIFFIFICIFFSFSYCDDLEYESINVSGEIEISSTLSSDIKNLGINSRACVVIDRNSNTIIFGKNENERRKMASTTKIMTAIIVIENSDLNEIVEVSKKAAATGGSRLGLKYNDKITVHDLLYGLMLRSGNDAAVCLAEHTSGSIDEFSNLMNKKAKDLGLENTNFQTPHGLDSDDHYTTAYELALLSNYALKNEIFAKIVSTKSYTVTINGYTKQLSNTNELLGNFEGIYGIKTGFTNGANRCLVTACKRDNFDIICVVLGADTKKFRTSDSIKLINYTYQNFELVNIQEIINNEFSNWEKNNINSFSVNKGIFNNFNLTLDTLEHPIIPIKKDLIDSLSVSIDCGKYFEAPINEYSHIGTVTLMSSDKKIAECKILNTTYINKKTIFYYFYSFFRDYNSIMQNIII